MNKMNVLSWVLIILGAAINFLVPIALKKKGQEQESLIKSIYIVKSLGLILVIIGCIIIFWLGGKFGV